MSTIHEFVAESVLADLRKSGEADEALAYARDFIRLPQWSFLLHAMGQPGRGWSEIQLAALWELLLLHAAGDLGVVRIALPCGHGPHRDVKRAENQELLDGLPSSFRATVNLTQRNSDDDGEFRWSVPLLATTEDRPQLRRRLVPPGVAPLEIGQTLASRTLQHLAFERAVARWAYDRAEVVLLYSFAWERVWGTQSAGGRPKESSSESAAPEGGAP
ncbi:hypothetical protein ACQEVZ_20455 [Dactylosporangium sp. CA-152071]|uniref:hypothetical protein n=1 Tax=Dactylosporangium sp. CA-152071 TaxID=3239933 RepID=UPI003D8E1B6A